MAHAGEIVAASVTSEPKTEGFGDAVSVVVFGNTWKVRVTGIAARYRALPAWLAWIEQGPAVSSVTVLPVTVQTSGVVEAKLTGRPELDVALTLNGASPAARSAG